MLSDADDEDSDEDDDCGPDETACPNCGLKDACRRACASCDLVGCTSCMSDMCGAYLCDDCGPPLDRD